MAPGGPDGCGARWTAQAARPEARAERNEHDAVQDKLAGPAATRTAAGPGPAAARFDRAETIVIGALLAAFLAAAPVRRARRRGWAHDSAARQAQAQRASLVRGHGHAAVVGTYPGGLRVGVRFRCRGPLARPGRAGPDGELFVTRPARPRATARGYGSTRPARRRSAAEPGPDDRPGSTGRGGGSRQPRGVLATAGWLVRRSLDRRRLSGWDTEWLANGPRWSPRR